MASIETLSFLPDPVRLRKLCQSLAMLDAILCPRIDLRTHTFDARWGVGEMMAKMDNGGGDDYFILFNSAGAIIKGFDHESAMSPYGNDDQNIWSGVLNEVPSEFESFLKEPAFSIGDITFCIWKRYADARWEIGTIDYPNNDENTDGASWMLSTLDGNPMTYQDWAKDSYEQSIDLTAVEHIYEHQPLTTEIFRSLNVDLLLNELAEEIAEIGYGYS